MTTNDERRLISSRFSVVLLRSYIAYGSDICLGQVILLTTLAVVVRKTTHFACSVGSYTSTYFFEDGMRGAAATRKRTPSTSICTQSLVRSVFLHQSDKWHNEATPLNVRAVSVSLPAGLCRMAEGGNT